MELLIYKWTLSIILLLVFFGYARFILKNFGLLPSISKSYYEYEKFKQRKTFQLFIHLMSVIIMLFGFLYNSWLLGIAGFIFNGVGLFPTIKNKIHFIWHMISAITPIILCLIYLIIFKEQLFLLAEFFLMLIAMSCVVKLTKDNFILIIEVISFATILNGLIMIHV